MAEQNKKWGGGAEIKRHIPPLISNKRRYVLRHLKAENVETRVY